ncbi:MAG TPA: DUF2934 domain-containing protein [Blastocatellia bacterium]|nr:DUF2934 domain-containing protein [Blastocatellia bacterium]
MKPESTEDLRKRLLKDEQVQIMISMRAYEIYKMRGSQPGHDAEDWFRAENEILTFLIQEESRRETYSHEQGLSDEIAESRPAGDARPQAFEPQTEPETADRLEEPVGQLAEEKAESHSALGVWSPAEPASAAPAPPLGGAAEETEAPTKKKTRSRASSKSTEPRKRKTTASAPKEGAAKKPTARRASSKKSPEGK